MPPVDSSAPLSATIEVGSLPIRFALDDPADEVQRHIFAGDFYERDQLEFHRTVIPRNGRILDLGANIGNHSVYYSEICNAEMVVSVEPSARACRLLQQTLEWNKLDRIDFVPEVAVGAGDGWGLLDEHEADHHNLGGTSVKYVLTEASGMVPVRTGDAILGDRQVDFIKIDVEGSELQVLTGLQSTIHSQSPVIAVEVMAASKPAFFRWCERTGYRIERTFQMYRGIMNYVCFPSA
jgi:FkbM family methyltransferase